MTNPTDPAAVEAWLTAMDEGRLVPCLAEHCPACEKAARIIQAYGDQREADARADERARVVAWLLDLGDEETSISDRAVIDRIAHAVERGDHLKGSGDDL